MLATAEQVGKSIDLAEPVQAKAGEGGVVEWVSIDGGWVVRKQLLHTHTRDYP